MQYDGSVQMICKLYASNAISDKSSGNFYRLLLPGYTGMLAMLTRILQKARKCLGSCWLMRSKGLGFQILLITLGDRETKKS